MTTSSSALAESAERHPDDSDGAEDTSLATAATHRSQGLGAPAATAGGSGGGTFLDGAEDAAPLYVGVYCAHQRVGPCSQCLRPHVRRVGKMPARDLGSIVSAHALVGTDEGLARAAVKRTARAAKQPPKLPTAPRPKAKRTEVTRERIMELHAEGLWWTEIARVLGCGVNTVRRRAGMKA